MIALQCQICGTQIEPPRTKFCSKKCRNKWHNDRQVWAERPDREKQNKRRASDPLNAQRMREWRAAHPERAREQHKRSREKHRGAVLERMRRWHAKNKNQQNAKRLRWHYAHQEQTNRNRKMHYQTTRAHAPWKHIVNIAKNRAKAKNIPFSLTHEWGEAKWTGCCELTNIAFTLSNKQTAFSPSLDRIKPNLGYVPDNCRFILFGVNALKGTGTDEDMFRIASALVSKTPLLSIT